MHKVLRGILRERWGKLTDGELDRVDGQLPRLTALLAQKYGLSQRRAERELLAVLDESMPSPARGGPAPAASAPKVAGVGVARQQRGEAANERGQRHEGGGRALVGAAEVR